MLFTISPFVKPFRILLYQFVSKKLWGCSSSAKKPEIDHTKVKHFATRGYDSGIEYATAVAKLSLNIEMDVVEPPLFNTAEKENIH